MNKTLRLLVLALLLGAAALAAPWRLVAPKGEKFRCQMPAGKLQESKNAQARQWLFLERGQYVLQVASIAQAGSPSQVNFYVAEFLKSAKITETSRKPVKVNGISGLEVAGTLPPTAKAKVSIRLRVFATKDHIYHQAAFLTGSGNKQVADKFFQSFLLK